MGNFGYNLKSIKESVSAGDLIIQNPALDGMQKITYRLSRGAMNKTTIGSEWIGEGYNGTNFVTANFPIQHWGATRSAILIEDTQEVIAYGADNGEFMGPSISFLRYAKLGSYFESTDHLIDIDFGDIPITQTNLVYTATEFNPLTPTTPVITHNYTPSYFGWVYTNSLVRIESDEWWESPLTITIEGPRVFYDRVDWENYLRTGYSGGDPDRFEGVDNQTGDPYTDTAFNEINNDPVLARTLLLTKPNMNAIAEHLYDDSESLWQQIFDGLSQQYGENPMSFIVDCFYIPFNPHNFIETEQATDVNFGITSNINIGTHEVVKKTKKNRIGQAYLQPSYNDFRDMMCTNYYINLPYAGIYSLDIERYYKKWISVVCSFDIRTGTIKYYILGSDSEGVDGVVYDIFEGSVRMNIPLISTDTYQNAVTKVSSLASGVAAGASIAAGNVVGGAAGVANAAISLAKEPTKHVSGGFSSASGLIDTKDVYIIIEQTEIDYPSTLKITYGMPDNKVTNIGSFNGFIQVDDIVLRSSARESVKQKAIAALREGIFV